MSLSSDVSPLAGIDGLDDDVVAAIREVPGVAEAELELEDETAGPDSPKVLRLALAPDVDEVTVASSVGRLLRDRFGLGVDTGRVQLVEEAEAVGLEASAGPSIERMHLVSAGREVTAAVTLTHRGVSATGEAQGLATAAGQQRAVAAATCSAVAELAEYQIRPTVDSVDVTGSGDHRAVAVRLTVATDAGRTAVTGSAVLFTDIRQGVIRAVLDAVGPHL